MARKPTTTASLAAALAALKPFAHLPIREDQPDDAHPAFQIKVEFVRAARELFPEDFADKAENEPAGGDQGASGSTEPSDDKKAAGEPETSRDGETEA